MLAQQQQFQAHFQAERKQLLDMHAQQLAQLQQLHQHEREQNQYANVAVSLFLGFILHVCCEVCRSPFPVACVCGMFASPHSLATAKREHACSVEVLYVFRVSLTF